MQACMHEAQFSCFRFISDSEPHAQTGFKTNKQEQ